MRTHNTHSFKYLRVFLTSVQDGSITMATSISHLHFSLILKIVLEKKVPISLSLRLLTILEIFEGAFWSFRTLISVCSLSDKSFCESKMACSSRRGWTVIQTTAAMEVPLIVICKKHIKFHRTLLLGRWCSLTDTPPRINLIILFYFTLSFQCQ